jgi:hypothetical protein
MDFLDHKEKRRTRRGLNEAVVKQNKDKGIFELKHCSTKKMVEVVQPNAS